MIKSTSSDFIADFSKVGVLAAGPVGILQGDAAIGHRIGRGMVDFMFVGDRLDGVVDVLK